MPQSQCFVSFNLSTSEQTHSSFGKLPFPCILFPFLVPESEPKASLKQQAWPFFPAFNSEDEKGEINLNTIKTEKTVQYFVLQNSVNKTLARSTRICQPSQEYKNMQVRILLFEHLQ